jgi:hypothetical protein
MKQATFAYIVAGILLAIGSLAALSGAFRSATPSASRQEAAAASPSPDNAMPCGTLSFEQFPAGPLYAETPHEPDFSSDRQAYQFRTAIRNAVRSGTNFAGHYVVASWGCGTSCQESAIIDAATGAIAHFGIPSSYGIEVRATSSLLVVNPPSQVPDVQEGAQEGMATDYYEFSSGTLRKICSQPAMGTQEQSPKPSPSMRPSPEPSSAAVPPTGSKDRFCIQVITPARNPQTGEVRDFPTPCDVPAGWEPVQRGGAVQ